MMNCEKIKLAIHGNNHNNGNDMDHNDTKTIEQHIAQCDDCRNVYEQQQALTTQLRGIPRPHSTNTLKQRILADRITQQTQSRRQYTYYLGIAASVCVIVITMLVINSDPSLVTAKPIQIATQSSVSTVANKPSKVNFLVNSNNVINNVTFTLSVPPQMVLYGYNGQQTLSWNGSLKKGKNLLTVPVMALSDQTGILVMKISHDEVVKEYRVAINVIQNRVMAPTRTSGQVS